MQDIRDVCVEVSKSWECVESRLAARGDGVGGHETLAAVGTLLKGGQRFLAIWILLVTLLRNYVMSSNLWMSSSFFMYVKRLIRNMQSSSAWDFFISLSSIRLILLFSKRKASSWKFVFLFVPRFFFAWRSPETPSLNSSLSLSLIETSVEALSSPWYGVLPRADSSAAGAFDSVGRGVIIAFTNDIDVKYCRFDSCVVPAAWPDFVSCSFLSRLRYISVNVSHIFLRLFTWKQLLLGTDCYTLSRHKFVIFECNIVGFF